MNRCLAKYSYNTIIIKGTNFFCNTKPQDRGVSYTPYIYPHPLTPGSTTPIASTPAPIIAPTSTPTPTTTATSTSFSTGDRVVTTDTVWVRSATSTAEEYRLELKEAGEYGTVLDGPSYISDYGYVWKIDYESGSDGWSKQDYLTKAPAAVTVQGRHVDTNGNALTRDIGQAVTLSNGSSDTISLGAWDFSRITPGIYTVTVRQIPGYTISYSSCSNCTNHATYTSGNSVTVSLPSEGNYADIYFKYTPVPTSTPRPTSTPTSIPVLITAPISEPTSTPTSEATCIVETTPISQMIREGSRSTVTAEVISGLGAATITRMEFGSYNTSKATVSPTSDSTSIYSTIVTAVKTGTSAIWATAYLSDGRVCQSTGDTDTDIQVIQPWRR
jgi:hypothetical protein